MRSPRVFRKPQGVDWRRAPQPLEGVLVTRAAPGEDGRPPESATWHFHGGAETVWLLLDGSRSVAEVEAEVRRRFAVGDPHASIEDFIAYLLDNGLLEEAPASEPAR